MKFVNQLDYPHIHYSHNTSHPEKEQMTHGTFAKSGCGLASLMMVADRLLPSYKFDIRDAMQLMYDTGANRTVGSRIRYACPVFAYRFGLEFEMTNDPEAVRNCLRTGGCVIACSGGDKPGYTGIFTHGGHYIVLINEERDGRIAILDPAFKEGKYDEEARKDKVQVLPGAAKDKIILAEMQTLVEDCSNRDPGFYMFWRK